MTWPRRERSTSTHQDSALSTSVSCPHLGPGGEGGAGDEVPPAVPGLRQQPEQLPRVKLDVVVALDHVPRRPAPSLAPDVAAQDLAITVILTTSIKKLHLVSQPPVAVLHPALQDVPLLPGLGLQQPLVPRGPRGGVEEEEPHPRPPPQLVAPPVAQLAVAGHRQDHHHRPVRLRAWRRAQDKRYVLLNKNIISAE